MGEPAEVIPPVVEPVDEILADLPDVSQEEAEILIIQEKMGELSDLCDTVAAEAGVNKAIATAMESIKPGVLGSQYPIASFTDDYSRTNLKVALEELDNTQKWLAGGAIVLVAALVAKVIHWIYKYFTKGDGDEEKFTEADKIRAQAAETLKSVDDTIKDIAKSEVQWNKEYSERTGNQLEEMFGGRITNVRNLPPDRLIVELEKINKTEFMEQSKHKYTVLVEDLMNNGELHGIIAELVKDFPARIDALGNVIEQYREEAAAVLRGDNKIYKEVGDFEVKSEALQKAASALHITEQGNMAIATALHRKVADAAVSDKVKKPMQVGDIDKATLANCAFLQFDEAAWKKHLDELDAKAKVLEEVGKKAVEHNAEKYKALAASAKHIQNEVMATARMFHIVVVCNKKVTVFGEYLHGAQKRDAAEKAKILSLLDKNTDDATVRQKLADAGKALKALFSSSK